MFDREKISDRPFRTCDAARLGLTRYDVQQGLANGDLRRVMAGVLVAGDVPDDTELRVAAAELAVAPGHVIRDRTAAWLHGIDVFASQEKGIPPPVETCVLPGAEPSERIGVDARTRDLAQCDIMRHGSLLVTTPLRTALDLGGLLRRRTALGALDLFMREFGLTRDQLSAELPRFRRRRGVVQLRQLIPLADPRSESMRESWTRLVIGDAGLPVPVPQVWIEVDGEMRRLDLVYEAERIVVEYDGRDWHSSDAQVEDDRAKRRWLRNHGWIVIVVRRDDFADDALACWLSELRAALRERGTTVRWRRTNGRDRLV